jgi:hypothetical protein
MNLPMPAPETLAQARAVFDVLASLPPAEAALLRAHMRALAADALRQGMLVATSLLAVARDVALDVESVARSLPAMQVYFPEDTAPEQLRHAGAD